MAPRALSLLSLCLAGLQVATAQTPGKSPEVHPLLKTYRCTKADGCVRRTSAVVLDDLSHWVHQANDTSLGCGNWGSAPNKTACPDEATCAKNCIVEGISDYSQHGVTTTGDSITLDQLLPNGNVVTPRLYLLSETQKQYEMVQLLGNEISFQVDMSKMPCGMNGGLYLSEMSETGGQSTLNPGGAAYGTGYCDAQCFTYPFINGVGNIEGKGSCCNEMDLWEANAKATALTPHTCNHTGLYECTGAECTFNGVCDQWGCSYNPYAVGHQSFYGPGLTIDTNKPFTIVTQFPTDSTGKFLAQIRRLYIQNGKLIQNVAVNTSAAAALPAGINYIDDNYCNVTAGGSRFEPLGGFDSIGGALHRGMVLIFTIWWDTGGFMNWLDTGNSGPCNTTEGNPSVITQVQPNPAITFSAIKWGEIGSTYSV